MCTVRSLCPCLISLSRNIITNQHITTNLVTAKQKLTMTADDGIQSIVTEEIDEEQVKTEEEDHDDPVLEMPCIAKDITSANEAKEEGNNYFRKKDFDSAISSYSRAITLCPTGDDHKELLSVFLGNRAAAYFSVDEFDCVIDDCTASLELNPIYVKVLMRRSQAYEKLTRPEDALVGKYKIAAVEVQCYEHHFFPPVGFITLCKMNDILRHLKIYCQSQLCTASPRIRYHSHCKAKKRTSIFLIYYCNN